MSNNKPKYYEYTFNGNITPNRNNNNLKNDYSQLNSNQSFMNSYYNESNGVKLNIITDENDLKIKFDKQEKSIKFYCDYYESLIDVFDEADIKIKNKLVQYVTVFNNKCQQYSNKQTRNFNEERKKNENENTLKEALKKSKEDYNNLEEKNRKEKEELREKLKNEIKDLNSKIKDLEKDNKKLMEETERLKNTIKEQKNENIKELEKKLKLFSQQPQQPSSGEVINVSYYFLGDTRKELEINIGSPPKKEFAAFSPTFKKAEENFKKYYKLLVEISNRNFNKFKELYKKIKGKEWIDSNNGFIKINLYDTFNINQDLTWTNITHIQDTINGIVDEIFKLVNPTENCNPKKLSEDSCEFLLNYIIGLKKLFFIQKEILENSFDDGNDIEEKNKNFMNFKKLTNDAEKFFEKNEQVLRTESFFEKFKDVLSMQKTKNLSIDEYMKNMKSIFYQARQISEKRENDFNEFKKNLITQKNNNYEDIEIEMTNFTLFFRQGNNSVKIHKNLRLVF